MGNLSEEIAKKLAEWYPPPPDYKPVKPDHDILNRKLEEVTRYAFENTYRAWWTTNRDERYTLTVDVLAFLKDGKINILNKPKFYDMVQKRAEEISLRVLDFGP